MIVCAETNFILELTFLQEGHESRLSILALAESNDITLVLPSFSIAEAHGTRVRNDKRRKELYQNLVNVIKELSKSKPYREISEEFLDLVELLIKSGEEEKRRLDESLDRILNVARIIPITSSVFRSANLYQATSDLSSQDSIVYASVIEHLSATSEEFSCFITKDKGFNISEIKVELRGNSCKLFTGENAFENGLGYIRHILSRP